MPRKAPRNTTTRRKALKAGYRSGLEQNVAVHLKACGIPFRYEPFKLDYTTIKKAKGISCKCCGGDEIIHTKQYLPDFHVKGTDLLLESKGIFSFADRRKQLEVQAQNPDWDIVIIFQSPRTKVSPKSKHTYASWCDKNGLKWFAYSDKQKWIDYVDFVIQSK